MSAPQDCGDDVFDLAASRRYAARHNEVITCAVKKALPDQLGVVELEVAPTL